MRRIMLLWAVLASVSLFAGASPPDSFESPVLDTGFRLKVDADWVYVNASVRDPRDRSNRLGLGREDFLVYEDQILQAVGSCTPGQTPFNVLLLMDVSASTAPFIRILRDSALKFSGQLSPADRIAIMTFSWGSRLILPATNDRGRLKSALRFVTPSGSTAFYDALMSALRSQGRLTGRKAIVVFSDGIDNQLMNSNDGSEATFSELLDAARQSDCLIYSIFLSPGGQDKAQHPAVIKAEQQMETLAVETGGRMYKLRKVGELSANYAEIAEDLRFIYTLAYTPSPSAPAGWRTLRVEVKGHPELSVRARTGYLKRQESEGRSQKAE